MKKRIILLLSIAFIVSIIAISLNMNASTKQCINYECHTYKIPLYLKALDFMDRDLHYKLLIKEIIKDAKTEDDKALKILQWTYANIRRVPEGFPVIDDHVWHIIVRGYGASDQFQDVFTTLCNYAKIPAFLDWIQLSAGKERFPLSFVKLTDGWTVFDAYCGVYFTNEKGRIAGISDLENNNWRINSISQGPLPDYKKYFLRLETIDFKNWELSRAAIQSPLKRFIFWRKKLIF